ncbi:MAG: metallophosphoesterase family protein [Candidatus Sulfotelmatobacter sp.]
MTGHASKGLSHPLFSEPTFNEEKQTVDPTGFLTEHPSDKKIYDEVSNLLSKQTTIFDKSRMADDKFMSLGDVYGEHGAEVIDHITKAKKIIFHVLGDSGASVAGKKFQHELSVADQVTLDSATSNQDNHPAFAYHLGDVVYDFGEKQYYYDQFYEPFRDYPLPIFAIPGNHDCFVTPGTPDADEPLKTFARNFCSEKLVITPEARSLHRTAMQQPGVYFTLDAPFVRIIGLFSNALEDPGVISSQADQKKQWPEVPDFQLSYLEAQFKTVKESAYKGAVILAVHHPPFSYGPPPKIAGKGGNHGSSSDMLRQIDSICTKVGVYPHAILSAHAHNYQRYTREITFAGKDYDVPMLVSGDSGHNVNPLVRGSKGKPGVEPHPGISVKYLEKNPAVEVKDLILEKYEDHNYGYLRVTVDDKLLRIGFHQVGVNSLAQSRFDFVTVNIETHQMVAN